MEGERDRMVITEDDRWAQVLTRGCPSVTEVMVLIGGVGAPVWVIVEGPALLVVCLEDSPWHVDRQALLMARVASVWVWSNKILCCSTCPPIPLLLPLTWQ